MYRIGIIGSRQDFHVQCLVEECAALKMQPVPIDFRNYPKYNLLTLAPDIFYDDLRLKGNIRLQDLHLLLIRNFFCTSEDQTENREDFTVSRERDGALLNLEYSFARIAETCLPVINTAAASRFHAEKAFQYFLLHSRGINVPRTLVTNNRAQIDRFIRELGHRVIVKPNAGGAEVVQPDAVFFEQNAAVLPARPFIFQQMVRGRSFRAYVLGGRIVAAAEIFYDRRFIDWREREQQVIACTPEAGVQEQIERAVRILGLAYCGVDYEWDDHNRQYYLLDFNPAALFTGFGKLVNINMAAEIAEYILAVLESGGNTWVFSRDK